MRRKSQRDLLQGVAALLISACTTEQLPVGVTVRSGGPGDWPGGNADLFEGNSGNFDRNGGDFDRNGGDFDRNGGDFDRNSGDYERNGGDFDRNSGRFLGDEGWEPTLSYLARSTVAGFTTTPERGAGVPCPAGVTSASGMCDLNGSPVDPTAELRIRPPVWDPTTSRIISQRLEYRALGASVWTTIAPGQTRAIAGYWVNAAYRAYLVTAEITGMAAHYNLSAGGAYRDKITWMPYQLVLRLVELHEDTDDDGELDTWRACQPLHLSTECPKSDPDNFGRYVTVLSLPVAPDSATGEWTFDDSIITFRTLPNPIGQLASLEGKFSFYAGMVAPAPLESPACAGAGAFGSRAGVLTGAIAYGDGFLFGYRKSLADPTVYAVAFLTAAGKGVSISGFDPTGLQGVRYSPSLNSEPLVALTRDLTAETDTQVGNVVTLLAPPDCPPPGGSARSGGSEAVSPGCEESTDDITPINPGHGVNVSRAVAYLALDPVSPERMANFWKFYSRLLATGGVEPSYDAVILSGAGLTCAPAPGMASNAIVVVSPTDFCADAIGGCAELHEDHPDVCGDSICDSLYETCASCATDCLCPPPPVTDEGPI